ncbi:Clavaminate synthase-like protein [Epithele typhae]|uniref:Clavaminate synthase-like protein n=1 Tax=Epithele typhae TaxID=378194 RepID=UPI0020081CC3|nr:Clavaminate synthase-like protein [Epithele typhae]KAH9927146.1 Clavaminate synthase-like protein [Epithele typhae]
MQHLHDPQVHNKRTSINELLNPQLPPLATALQYHHHLPPPPATTTSSSVHPHILCVQRTGSRAATTSPQPQPPPAHAHPHAHPQSSYPESYQHPHSQHQPQPQKPRPPRADQSSPYSIDGRQAWSPTHDTPGASYGPPPMMAPAAYADERQGQASAAAEPASRSNYPPPPPPPPAAYGEVAPHPHPSQQPPVYAHSAYLPYPYPQPPPRGAPSLRERGPASPQGYYAHPVNMAFAAIPLAAPPAVQQKRAPEPADDDQAGPKSKKARAAKPKPEPTSAAARRGSNGRKRNDSQAVSQNAEATLPLTRANVTVLIRPPPDTGKDKASGSSGPAYGAMRVVTEADGAVSPDATGPLQPELQFARCMSNRYRSEEFPRCVSCTRRWAGDTCRFQGIRFFLKNQNRDIVGISFVESQKPDAPTMTFPNKWNVPLQMDHIFHVQRVPILSEEVLHMARPEIILRPRENEVRATCDTCMTSIFTTSWMCRLCGREACAECFAQVKELTVDRADATEAENAQLQARREKHAHINPFFLSCTRRNEHQAKDFSPMSRFCKAELQRAITEMEAVVKGAARARARTRRPDGSPTATYTDVRRRTAAATTSGFTYAPSTAPSSSASAAPSTTPAAAPVVPSHVTVTFTEAECTDARFRSVWETGVPLVVTGLGHRFRISWTPEHFAQKYGTQSCLILECQTEQNKRVTVGEFFALFGKYEGRMDCWKLKDWPPSTDFKTAFPDLYEDFSNAVPVPNYVRRDGVFNIASHFPTNSVGPDLGPKMYNAMASFESQGSKGSTRLHMDMADAVNIMTYASATPDGRPGCAAWDIYRAEDTGKLRKFLRRRFKGQYQHDPIHSQQFYLDASLRQELYREHNVISHRIYQRPGEAVFIPAGCAHQVCNLADCIKVAADFVSPENIERCETLTREFREQNQSMAWKEDVLQLRTMMWFAWLSCVRQEKDLLEN